MIPLIKGIPSVNSSIFTALITRCGILSTSSRKARQNPIPRLPTLLCLRLLTYRLISQSLFLLVFESQSTAQNVKKDLVARNKLAPEYPSIKFMSSFIAYRCSSSTRSSYFDQNSSSLSSAWSSILLIRAFIENLPGSPPCQIESHVLMNSA